MYAGLLKLCFALHLFFVLEQNSFVFLVFFALLRLSVVVIRQVSEIRKIRLELRNGAFLKASAPILPSASELSFIRPFLIIFTFSASGPFTEQWTHFGLFRSRYFSKSLHSSIYKKIVEMASMVRIQFNGFSVMIFKKSAVVCLVSW